MPDLGMPTLIETKSLRECALLCRELGLRFVEVNMNLPQYQNGRMNPADFLSTAEEFGIYYTIHLDENLNVSDFNPLIAEAYRQTVRETIVFAGKIGCPVLNMHLSRGVYFTMPDRKIDLFNEYKEQYLQSMMDFRDECEKDIGKNHIRICIENAGGYTDFQRQALSLLMKSPVFGLTLDVGHNHSIGCTDEPMILGYPGKLYHMHLHDALGRKNHLPLGTGEINIGNYLKLAKEKNCRVVLETKTIAGLRQSVEWYKKYSEK